MKRENIWDCEEWMAKKLKILNYRFLKSGLEIHKTVKSGFRILNFAFYL